eukprot:403366312
MRGQFDTRNQQISSSYIMNNVRIQAIDDPLNFLMDGAKHQFGSNLTSSLNSNDYQNTQDNYNSLENHIVNQNQETIINPCPFHTIDTISDDYIEATHLCIDEKLALCDQCAIQHSKKKNHQILNLQNCVNETRVVLSQVEGQIKEIIKDKQSAVSRGKNVVKMLETKKQRYMEKQQLKLEKVIKLLQDQMRISVEEYEEKINQKYGRVLEQMQHTENRVGEKEEYLKDVQHLRKVFGKLKFQKFNDFQQEDDQDGGITDIEHQIADESQMLDKEVSQKFGMLKQNNYKNFLDKKLEVVAQSSRGKSNNLKSKKRDALDAQVNLDQIQRKKIRIVRWKTKKIAEFELDTHLWTLTDAQVSQIFLPYSRSVYLPNQDLVNLGGLDDSIPSKPHFTQTCEMLSQVSFNDDENLYVPTPLHQMRKGRGCFSACYHDEFIYVLGGVNMEEGVLSYCEKYDTEKDIWYEIKDLTVPRKNSSVCPLTADTLYVFGGTDQHGLMQDTIEMFLISANMWILLSVKMPNPISFLTTFKVSPFQIILLGGLIESDSDDRVAYPSNQVLQFDIRFPDIFRSQNLDRDFVSIYPAFYDDDGKLLLINEDGRGDSPQVLKYDINRYLIRPSNYLAINDDI